MLALATTPTLLILKAIILILCLIGGMLAGAALGRLIAFSEVSNTPAKCDKFLSVDDEKIIRAQNLFYDQCRVMQENPQIAILNQSRITSLYEQMSQTKQAILDIRCEICSDTYCQLLDPTPNHPLIDFFRKEHRDLSRQRKQKENSLKRLLTSYHDCLNQINALLAISIINANIPIEA